MKEENEENEQVNVETDIQELRKAILRERENIDKYITMLGLKSKTLRRKQK